MKTTILPLPVFVARIPPATPNKLGSVINSSATLSNPVKALVAAIIASEFAKFCINAVHEFESLLIDPSQLEEDFCL